MALWWGKSQALGSLVWVSRTSVNRNFRGCRGMGVPQPGSVPEGKGTGKIVYTTTCGAYLSSYSRIVLRPPKVSLILLCFNFFLSLLLRWYFLLCTGTYSLSCSEKKGNWKVVLKTWEHSSLSCLCTLSLFSLSKGFVMDNRTCSLFCFTF